MAKKVFSLNLDEETIEEVDILAKKMGVSRSTLCEITLKTAVDGQDPATFTKWLFSKPKKTKRR